MPKNLADFQDLKYNKNNKFEELKAFKKYRTDNPKATRADYQRAVEIKEAGIQGDIHIPPREIPNIDTYEFDDYHANAYRKHNVTEQEARQFVNNAEVSITRWNGRFECFFSHDGATYVDLENSTLGTAFKSTQFDNKAKIIMGIKDE